MKPTYTCTGPVRGNCGVRHRSLSAAVRCCARDMRDVRKGHGSSAYSDRQVVRADGGRMAEREMLELDHLEND